MSCSVLPIASALHGDATRAALLASLDATLASVSAQRIGAVGDAAVAEPFAVLALTGGTEQMILAAHTARQQSVPGEPLLVLAHSAHNSLPAALEATARLNRDGARARIVVLDDAGGSDELVGAVHDVEVWHGLHATRIGVLGQPSDWLVASTPDRDAVHRVWGPRLIDLDMPTALHRMTDTAGETAGVPVRFRVRSAATPPEADVEKAVQLEPVLRELIEREHLDAITVRCFDLILDAGTSGCLALSALNDSGVIAGCEGDIASTLALLWAKLLIGRVGWMANPAMIHRSSGIVELAHCTVPLSLVNGYELQTHFESGLGVGIAGDLPAGPVTLLRLGGEQLEQLWCADGDAFATASRDDRCRTQLDIGISPTEAGQLLDHPLGNHLVVVDGHHASHFTRWWQSLIQRS